MAESKKEEKCERKEKDRNLTVCEGNAHREKENRWSDIHSRQEGWENKER